MKTLPFEFLKERKAQPEQDCVSGFGFEPIVHDHLMEQILKLFVLWWLPIMPKAPKCILYF
jgi:hypothetical protein